MSRRKISGAIAVAVPVFVGVLACANPLEPEALTSRPSLNSMEVGASGRAPQTIGFDLALLPRKTLGDARFSVAGYATATSGLAVTFSSASPRRCAVTADGWVTLLDAGVGANGCVIVASQQGNEYYDAAPDVSAMIDVHVPVRIQPGHATASISWGRKAQPELVVVIASETRAGGAVVFDATRIDARTVLVIGPSGTARIAVDRKGNVKVAWIDLDCDGDLDLVFHVAKVELFAAADVGRTHTLVIEANLKLVVGDDTRDGRLIRGFGGIRLDP